MKKVSLIILLSHPLLAYGQLSTNGHHATLTTLIAAGLVLISLILVLAWEQYRSNR